MSTFSYPLTASLYLVLFYGCYALFLRRNTFFGLNRAYLLLSVLASLALPFVELPSQATESLPVGTVTLPAFTVGAADTSTTDGLSLSQWLWLIYGAGVAVMLIRLVVNLRAVFTLIRTGTVESWQGLRLVQLPDDSTPSFSFGRYLVLSQTDALLRPDMLIRHEIAHIRQRHTADILFIELVWAAFWFNPVLYFYKRSLQEVHEFLADQAAVRQETNPQNTSSDYARQLVAYALQTSPSALTTPFASLSTLKQRILMLQKPASNRSALLRYALVLPVAALLIMCTQPEKELVQVEKKNNVITDIPKSNQFKGVQGEVYTVVEKQPEFPGGMKALGNYMEKNLKYPMPAQRANVSGRVFLSFIVTTDGEIKNVEVLKGLGFGTDEEALRVVAAMPRWTPGSQDGVPVNVKYNLPINFVLEEEGDIDGQTSEDLKKTYNTFLVNGKSVGYDGYIKAMKAVTALMNEKDSKIGIQFDAKNGVLAMKTENYNL
ncbi:TonB family protein [Spirosoma sp. KUDC1026]|uniref:M56 family metallopeptidase n=1 Tax=Spirosoma sp. KUDC1026 TaxID=2745947 RepID=UPI00159B9848|nr:M56 family metallopeptidase [Spirosoma sp. KUDC1026]QKZ11200.1 M56 family metallopeptidase [Spirosoma sp. KUDC1026]